MKIAMMNCLGVWRFLSFDQFQQYHHEWLSGRACDDVVALLLSLVAIGSRYIDEFYPSCADGITIFRYAEKLLVNAPTVQISAVYLKAVYVSV